MPTAKEKFRKILELVSPILLDLNNGKYADIGYRMMAISAYLEELRAKITPQKSCLESGTITIIYLENKNRVDIYISSLKTEKFAQLIRETIGKEKFGCVTHLKLPAPHLSQEIKEKSEAKHEILFSNPVFHKGININVRNGDKWMRADVGDLLDIKSSKENRIILTAIVIGKALIPFSLIQNQWLLNEHDPFCRNAGGLYEEMKRLYPGFTKDSLVTVLFFLV